jgi:uncharacterized protein (DUF58 family)
MLPRQNTKICREGWYYLFVTLLVFLGAIFKEVNLLLILSGMMMGLLLFHWQALIVTLQGLKLNRKAPDAVCAGDVLSVGLQLSNSNAKFGSWAVNVDEPIRRESASLSNNNQNHRQIGQNHNDKLLTSVFFPYLPVGEQRSGTYRGRLYQRGLYRLGPARVSTRFPFGLLVRSIKIGECDSLYVYPRLGRLTRQWLARHRRALSGSDRRQSRPGPEGDFYGVREWHAGDNMKLIHWRGSARTGKLVVRQFEQPHNRDVAIILDIPLPDKYADKHLQTIETAISFAATALTDLCRQGGGKVHLGIYNGQPHCLGGPASSALLQDIMKILAMVEPQSDYRLPDLLDLVFNKIAPGTEIIVVSTHPVNLSDESRFAGVWSDPARLASVGNIRLIDASSDELKEFFVAE